MNKLFFARRILESLRVPRGQPAQLRSLRDIATRSLALSADDTTSQEAQKGEASAGEAREEGDATASDLEASEVESDAGLKAEQGEGEPIRGEDAPLGGEDEALSGEDEEFTEGDEEMLEQISEEAWELLEQEVFDDEDEEEPTVETVNLAGSGRSGWENLWHGEEDDRYWWALDLTGGKVHDNGRNALLCDESKLLMGIMYQQGIPAEEIAAFFRVREQRVLAILALQKIDAQHHEAGLPLWTDLQEAMEGGPFGEPGYFECDEVIGSGERHVRLLPRAPHYEVGVDSKGNLVRKDFDKLEEEVAAKEDEMMIKEFKERLAFNMGEIGKRLRRNIKGAHRPRRPKGGFGLVVKPKSKDQKPFVALPDGTRRELNEDESVLQQRQRVRRRRRYM